MLSSAAALTFLPFAIAIGIWVAWSDMRYMRIPNPAVLALGAVYLVTGPLVLPFGTYLWGWALGAIVLGFGFVLNAGGALGAGDAKFGAAMAPFFVGTEARNTAMLLAACLIGALVAHRGLRMVPVFRAATPGWKSWTVPKDFPVGLSLAGMLLIYLLQRLIVA